LEVCSRQGAIQIHVYLTSPYLHTRHKMGYKKTKNVHDINFDAYR